MKRKTLEMLQRSKPFHIPKKVPIFPLPSTVLFPDADLPLYIFEPKYRRMLTDVLEQDKLIAISLLKNGWEKKEEPYPCSEIVGIGYVRAAINNPDGTSHIILRGIGRAKIKRYAQLKPYRIAEIEQIKDKRSRKTETQRLARELKPLLLKKLRYLSDQPQNELKDWDMVQNPYFLANISAFVTILDPQEKQKLLENRDLAARLKALIHILGDELYPKSSFN